MALNEQDVARIARLARIELTPDQRSRAQGELNGILHLIERLQAADTQGVEPLAHPLSAHQDIALRLRPDRSEEHTSELQSLMRISYAVFSLKKKKIKTQHPHKK